MKKLAAIIGLILLALFFSTCDGGGGDSSTPSQPGAFVEMRSGGSAGDVVFVDIYAGNLEKVFGASIKIAYDPSELKWSGYSEGDFFGTPGTDYAAQLDEQAGEGLLVIGIAGSGEVGGSGKMITLGFQIIGSGAQTRLSFVPGSRLLDSTAPVPVDVPAAFYGVTISEI